MLINLKHKDLNGLKVKTGKNFKIWGMSYGVIGDLIMGLPMLTYYEKKYPQSYKYWVIEKKCAKSAPLFFNHPLIDKIHITGNWSLADGFSEEDKAIAAACDEQVICEGWAHTPQDWYNYRSCVEETARVAGITDLTEILSADEMRPKLFKWFNEGLPKAVSTYTKTAPQDSISYSTNIAIWPFAGTHGRSPSPHWWSVLIDHLLKRGYSVHHFGLPSDPVLSMLPGYRTFPELSYFEQVKASLSSKLVIGTDSGAQWVMGAYSHPAINLMTNWLPNHTQNLLALEPINDNGITFFESGSCDEIPVGKVLKNILERVPL